jgi:hypothetical protein
MLRQFQFAAVLQVVGDAGGAESMIADLRLDAGYTFDGPLGEATTSLASGKGPKTTTVRQSA